VVTQTSIPVLDSQPNRADRPELYEAKTREIARQILAASKGGFWDRLKDYGLGNGK
jgi:hypothetical protein